MKHTRVIFAASLLALSLAGSAAADTRTDQKLPLAKFPPVISDVGITSATVALPAIIDAKDFSRSYFEYGETHQVCIMIYPTPASCLPKTTTKGATSTVLKDLKPGTEYFVKWKLDSQIQCIKAPCPTNEEESDTQTFTTLGGSTTSTTPIMLGHDLRYRMNEVDVATLQNILIQKGFLTGNSTGYFGAMTLKAVKAFQKSVGISPTGYVGTLTRAALTK